MMIIFTMSFRTKRSVVRNLFFVLPMQFDMHPLKGILFGILCFCFLLTPAFSQNADIELLHNINKNSSPFMDKVFPVITQSATPVTIAVPIGLFITAVATKNDTMKKKSYTVAVSIIAANVFTTALKFAVNRERPFNKYPSMVTKKSDAGSPSFPSGHTTTAFATATSLSLAYPRWYVIAPSYLWACSVAYSRMYLGVHYPSDVLGGIVIGAGLSYLTYKGNQWLNNKKNRQSAVGNQQ